MRGMRDPTSLDLPLELPSSFSLDAARSFLFAVAVPLQEESPELLPSLSLRSKSINLAAICTGHTRQPLACIRAGAGCPSARGHPARRRG